MFDFLLEIWTSSQIQVLCNYMWDDHRCAASLSSCGRIDKERTVYRIQLFIKINLYS